MLATSACAPEEAPKAASESSGKTPQEAVATKDQEQTEAQEAQSRATRYLDSLDSALPASTKSRVQDAASLFISSQVGLEGAEVSRIVPVAPLGDTHIRHFEVKLQTAGKPSGYLVLAINPASTGAWVDVYSESTTTSFEAFLSENPVAIGASKLYRVGPLGVAAESENEQLLAHKGLLLGEPTLRSDWWSELKSQPRQSLAQEMYQERDSLVKTLRDGDIDMGGDDFDFIDCRKNKFVNRVVGGISTPKWNQFVSEFGEQRCWVGCSPLAVGMYMAWAERAWPSVDFFPRKGGLHQTVNRNSNPRNNDSAATILEIRKHLKTRCGVPRHGTPKDAPLPGSTSNSDIEDFQMRMNHALGWLQQGRTRVRAEYESVKGAHTQIIRDKLYGYLKDLQRPVFISGDFRRIPGNNGWYERRGHSWLIDGYQYPTIKGCEARDLRVRMNLGHGGVDWYRLDTIDIAIERMGYFKWEKKKCNLRVGDRDYCKECGPCFEGQGSCTDDSECVGELLECQSGVGRDYGFHRSARVCAWTKKSSCRQECNDAYRECLDMNFGSHGKPATEICRDHKRNCRNRC